MSKPICRFATADDLEQLVELRILMQRDIHATEKVDPSYPEEVRLYFAEAIADGSYVSAVAEIDGKLVAAVGMVIYRKPPSLNARAGRVGYISNVYTAPEYRGRGLASNLMRLIVSFAKDSGVNKLHLGATDAGLGVYKRVGFKEPRYPQFEMSL